MPNNKAFTLAHRPVGFVDDKTFNFGEEPLRELQEGEVLIKIQYISLDPAMRGWMNDGKSYIKPVQIGEVMRAGTAGQVVESKAEGFSAGDFVTGYGGVQEYYITQAKHLVKVDTSFAPLPTYLSVLGMPGMTAYFGILDTGQPKAGETVLVSGAAGAVGSVVGQIAKIKGCRAVGIAGGPEKCKYVVEELGFDDCIDYKNQDEHLRTAIKRTCPQGVDVYFDNVGGEILDTVLTRINMKARIVICGAISQYNNTTPIKGPSNYLSLLVNRARMEGIVVMDNIANYGKAAKEMAGWMAQGKLKSKEYIVDGLENFPSTLMRLFDGKKLGKLVLKVAD
ncbi:MAG: NADP-dependent oxidoreductase [Bacteroidota bacterium]